MYFDPLLQSALSSTVCRERQGSLPLRTPPSVVFTGCHRFGGPVSKLTLFLRSLNKRDMPSLGGGEGDCKLRSRQMYLLPKQSQNLNSIPRLPPFPLMLLSGRGRHVRASCRSHSHSTMRMSRQLTATPCLLWAVNLYARFHIPPSPMTWGLSRPSQR